MYQRHSAALRACRRFGGLTQPELMHLMGLENRFQLSRIERGELLPKLEQALRYEYLFGASLKEMFPRLCAQVQNGLWEDIQTLLDACDSAKDARAKRKYKTLRAAKERIEAMSS